MNTTSKVNIDSLLKAELPPLPGTVMRVLELVQNVNSSTRMVSDAIGTDPALSALVLRAANSPLYAVQQRVTALPVAVNTLGNHTIHMLAVMSAAANTFGKNGKKSKFERAMWEHSVAVGITARELSRALGMRSEEEAFLCGLLHDIGKLIMMRHTPDLYQEIEVIADENILLVREQHVYGHTHAQIGALAAHRWKLPEEISHTICYHHSPSEAGNLAVMPRIIDLADVLANRSGYGVRGTVNYDISQCESAMFLQLSAEQVEEVWRKSADNLQAMIDLLN